MSANSSLNVCILKALSEEDKEDAYVKILKEAGISATFIPTLQFKFKNLDSLQQCLNNCEHYAGMYVSHFEIHSENYELCR